MVSDLGESPAPYNPVIVDTYLKGKQPFNPTLYEWLSRRGEIIEINLSSSYSIPKGYVFLLNSINASLTHTGATYLNIYSSNSGAVNSIIFTLRCVANGVANGSISFPLPIIYESEVVFDVDTGGTYTALLTGFLVKKDAIPQI